MLVRSLCVASMVIGFASPVHAAPRAPTGRWIVEFDDAQCVAQRNYGSKDEPLHLIIKEPPLGNVIQVAVVRPRGSSQATQQEGRLGFGDAKPLKLSVLRFEPKGAKATTYLFNVPRDQFTLATTARTLSINVGSVNEVFALTGVDNLVKVMTQCVIDLRKVWNITADGAGNLPSIHGPEGNLMGVLRHTDYPDVALHAEQSGMVEVTLLIDEWGKVSDCAIIETSKSAALDGQTCAVLRDRAKFKPGTGSDGKPVKGAFRQRITWRVQ